MELFKSSKFQAALLAIALGFGLLMGFAIKSEFFYDSSHFVTEYLLPLFFFAVGIELRSEFKNGYFRERKNVLSPAIAALLGVVFPAVFFYFVTLETSGSWAIPTATDITLGLAALSLVSLKLSSRLRAKFLALATIDDVIALLILLTVFSSKLDFTRLVLLVVCVAAFVVTERGQRIPLWFPLAIAITGIAVSVGSGIQTSLIGFVFGFLVQQQRRYAWLEDFNGLLILPLFGLTVGAMSGGYLTGGLSVLIVSAILLRPLGKLIGILLGGLIAGKLFGTREPAIDWTLIGLLGGLGLTVSLLVAQIAYKGDSQGIASGVVGTLLATLISLALFLAVAKSLDRRALQDEK